MVTYLTWDQSGRARLLDVPANDAPRLAAPEEVWVAFIAGEFTAAEGILRDHFSYVGPLKLIYPFAEGFDLLAEVAREVENVG